MAKNYKLLIFAGLSGIILALAFPGWNFNLGFLVWIGFVPLLYALANQSRSRSFLTGFVAGLFYFLIVFRWLWSIYPLDTVGIQSKLVSLIIVFLIYIISSAGMAVFWGLLGVIFNFQFSIFKKGKIPLILQLLIPTATFVLLEYARSYGFGLLWAGSGTLFGPHWTLGSPAYALAGNNLALKLSSYVGIYGIIFLIIFANLLFFKILAKKNPRSVGVVILIILLVTLGPKLLKQKSPSPDKEINFALIQTNQLTKISPTPKETLDAFKQQLDLLNRVAKEHPESQLIIFPETSDFFKNLSLFLTGSQIPNYFSNLFKEPRLILAGTRVIDTDDHAYSRVFALDTQKDIIGFYDKRLLMPGGEFLPYPIKFIVNLLSKVKSSEFGGILELGVGEKKVSTINFRGQFSIAPIVCSELLAPGLVREITRGSDIIVEMASYGVFHGNGVLIKQNLAIARFRAAENQKPLLAASNMGLSYAINSDGNVGFITQNQGAQILTGSIALNSQKSWYNRVGDLPTILASLALVVVFSFQLTVYRKIKTWLWRPK
jgi:apolipoprotein N-acyltransferase